MASYRTYIRDKETRNWFKAFMALKITKTGLIDFVDDVLTRVHRNIYQTVKTARHPRPHEHCIACSTENVLQCPTPGICSRNCKFHNTRKYQPCSKGICDVVRDEIIKLHRYKGPSWKNTNAHFWWTNPWEIGKCFLPKDGYSDVTTISDCDFNGLINILINCEAFDTQILCNTTKSAFLSEIRQIGRDVRHSPDQKVKDSDLVDYFYKLSKLLEDPTALANLPTSKVAVEQLKKLQMDKLTISAEDEWDMLKDGLRLRLANHYQDTLGDLPIAPLLPNRDVKLNQLYVVPKIVERKHRNFVKKEQEDNIRTMDVSSFSDIFYHQNIGFHRNVYLVGEPGMGKTSFARKCALEWSNRCLSTEQKSDGNSFKDVDFFENFSFLFYITLRDSCQICDLTRMIRDQIINKIYHEKDANSSYKIAQTVLESDTCLIIADGLDEWSHPMKGHCGCKREEKATPFRNSANKATILITTRPWRLSHFCISDSKIDKYLEIQGVEDQEILVKNVLEILHNGSSADTVFTDFMKVIERKRLHDLLSVPILTTQLACMWFEGIALTNSLCDINAGLIQMLFHRGCVNQRSIPGDINTDLPSLTKEHIVQNNLPPILSSLSELAYETLFAESRVCSVVFSSDIVYKTFSCKQVTQLLKSGLLTEKTSNSLIHLRSHFSFIHKTVQEFLAAVYLCINEKLFAQLQRHFNEKGDVLLQISRVFILMCGMKQDLANDMSEWINTLTPKCSCKEALFGNYMYEISLPDPETVSTLQQLMVAGQTEAAASSQNNTRLILKHFMIKHHQDEWALRELMVFNKSHIQTLSIFGCNDTISEEDLQDVFDHSSSSLTAVILSKRNGHYDISKCHNLEYISIGGHKTDQLQLHATTIRTCELCDVLPKVEHDVLSLFGQMHTNCNLHHLILGKVKNVQLLCKVLSCLSQVQFIHIHRTDLGELHLIPADSIEHISLWEVTMTAIAVKKLVERLENLQHNAECVLDECVVRPDNEMDTIRDHVGSSATLRVLKYEQSEGAHKQTENTYNFSFNILMEEEE
ncbi:uncharacterized protein LOC128245491 [Mya arenaria]|uniref:uncharacterized protein LOC128245491 n=1 Tax=Mya arenaria TaxID=6604 RepID=UPI0022E7664C|nr:uncharacterized protein LOC128245491 [Mya arenaria]